MLGLIGVQVRLLEGLMEKGCMVSKLYVRWGVWIVFRGFKVIGVEVKFEKCGWAGRLLYSFTFLVYALRNMVFVADSGIWFSCAIS